MDSILCLKCTVSVSDMKCLFSGVLVSGGLDTLQSEEKYCCFIRASPFILKFFMSVI